MINAHNYRQQIIFAAKDREVIISGSFSNKMWKLKRRFNHIWTKNNLEINLLWKETQQKSIERLKNYNFPFAMTWLPLQSTCVINISRDVILLMIFSRNLEDVIEGKWWEKKKTELSIWHMSISVFVMIETVLVLWFAKKMCNVRELSKMLNSRY